MNETIIESGNTCPISGIWKVTGTYTTTAAVSENSKMPLYGGVKVQWILLYKC
ncbi:hypothetical protein [Chryseobacterium taiwanense]|uniref:hypothetical protein n=1 Tax=Chryseobacterium taiwanense TaxID=363331 RepID=UPI000B22D79B|nr:hypothetical protein [Chryseobacterium taiwanense]